MIMRTILSKDLFYLLLLQQSNFVPSQLLGKLSSKALLPWSTQTRASKELTSFSCDNKFKDASRR